MLLIWHWFCLAQKLYSLQYLVIYNKYTIWAYACLSEIEQNLIFFCFSDDIFCSQNIWQLTIKVMTFLACCDVFWIISKWKQTKHIFHVTILFFTHIDFAKKSKSGQIQFYSVHSPLSAKVGNVCFNASLSNYI